MTNPPDIDLEIGIEEVCFLIIKARQFEVKEAASGLEAGSNPSDDKMVAVLEMRRGDPVYAELKAFIDALGEDAQIDIVTLAWIGRGDFSIDQWDEARAEADRVHTSHTADYLLGMPLLSEFLANALTEMGENCEDAERQHL